MVRQRNSTEYELPTGRDDDKLLTEFSELSTVELRPSLCVSDLCEPSQREEPHAARRPDQPQRRYVSSTNSTHEGHEAEYRTEPTVPARPPTESDRVPRH